MLELKECQIRKPSSPCSSCRSWFIQRLIQGFEKAGLGRPGICKIILSKLYDQMLSSVKTNLNLKYQLKYSAYGPLCFLQKQ